MSADGRMSRMSRMKCFVVMPYGTRKIKRKTGHGEAEVDFDFDFDRVYEDLYKKSAEGMDFEVFRSDKTSELGVIHKQMFTHIASDDLAIVDITSYNPNVFYELGVRHALRPAMTILTRLQGTSIPFNIQNLRVIEYPDAGGDFTAARGEIKKAIETALASNRPDSPIYDILRDVPSDWRLERLTDHREYHYRLSAYPTRQIVIVTGDILEWRGIDVWVNSENTNMQMARFFDRSLSATIRYEGAKRNERTQRIVDDTIAEALKEELGGDEWVEPGSVWVTGAGALTASHGVKKIFHAASVYGTRGIGYRMIEGIEGQCVTNALRRMDSAEYRDDGLRTVVFPMMGTGVGGGNVQVIAPRLIQAAVTYLSVNPDSRVSKVYFSAWSRRDLDACRAALASQPGVEAIPSPS